MGSQIPPSEYTVQTLAPLAAEAYESIYSQINSQNFPNLTTDVLYEMLGLGVPPVQTPTPKITTDQLSSYDQQRVFYFFNFWNRDNSQNFFNNLGADFELLSGIAASSGGLTQILQDSNIIVTYIVVFAFSIPTSPNGINISSPLNIFTAKTNTSQHNNASENLVFFLERCFGLGNVPVYSPLITDPNSVNTELIWNKGYVKIFCDNEYNQYCVDSGLDPSSQECVSGFRKKLSNSPTALNWCGCFTPLSSFVSNALSNVPNKQACDSFCYKVGGIKLYNPPSSSGSERAITCDNSQVCIIDNNNINSSNSQSTVTFNNICKCKENQACLCYVETSTPGILDNVSAGDGQGMKSAVIYNQKCTNSVCFTVNPITGVEKEVPCNPVNAGRTGDAFLNSAAGKTTLENYEKIDSSFWIFILFFLIVLLIYQFSFLEIKLS